jgi:RNA polymerase sigma factor (sigma-70 family)
VPATAELGPLLDSAAKGDEGAWAELVRRFEGLVLGIPREMGLCEADCEEVFQATWVAVFRDLHTIRKPRAFPAWIITATRRQAWRALRRRPERSWAGAETEAEHNVDGDGQTPFEASLGWERRYLLQQALGRISERCRRLLEALFSDSRPGGYGSIAARLGVPKGSIGPNRARCLEELARRLDRSAFGEE